MKKIRLFVPAALVAFASIVGACKDDSSETTPSLNGNPTFGMPSYVNYGDEYELKPALVTRTSSETDMVGYRFYNSLTAVYDTLRLETDDQSVSPNTTFKISKDTLGTFTATYTAFASGYYSSTATKTFYIVDDELNEGSLKGYDCIDDLSVFTDERDGKQYYYTTIGGTDWMAENLAWEDAGISFAGAPAMTNIYGMYYTWEEAQTACPDGWRLPEESDWVKLALAAGAQTAEEMSEIEGVAGALMIDATFNGSKMWDFWPAVKITNSTRFCAIPVGYASREDDIYFDGAFYYACWWSADEDEDDDDFGVTHYIYEESNNLFVGSQHKSSFATSVRCVK